MDIVEPLGVIVEFSIGLAGFTAVIAVFSSPNEEIASSLQFRIRNLLAMSFGPGFISILVIGLVYSELNPVIAIKIGSGVFAVYEAWLLIFALKAILTMPKRQRQQLSFPVAVITIGGTSLNIVAQSLNVVLTLSFASGVLILGLGINLLFAGLTFTTIVGQIMKGTGRAT